LSAARKCRAIVEPAARQLVAQGLVQFRKKRLAIVAFGTWFSSISPAAAAFGERQQARIVARQHRRQVVERLGHDVVA